MRIIDTHQHFWNYNPERHAWINEAMAAIRTDFLPQHLAPLLQEEGVEGCVTVQVDQTEEETLWMLQLAENNPFIKGVVGWVDLRSDTLEQRLHYFKQFPLLKGFRHILQAEDSAYMLQDAFVRGVRALGRMGFTYDILIYPQHLDAALELISKCPQQPFVIDHLAKPLIAAGERAPWEEKMRKMASFENVYCKISGMVTEANWQQWQPEHLRPYLDVVVEAFGCNRLMWGSDWPVCLVAASYKRWLQTARTYFQSFSSAEQEAVFAANAVRFYNLTEH